jgi:hypothetical protein
MARPEVIQQSTTAGVRTNRAPVDSLSTTRLEQSITQPQKGDVPTGHLLPALLWLDLKQSISEPQQGDRLTGRPSQCCQPFYGQTCSNPSLNHSRGTDSKGAPVSVASPFMARPEAIHHSTTAGGQTQRAPLSVLPALLWLDLKQSISQPQQGDRLKGRPCQCCQPFYGWT